MSTFAAASKWINQLLPGHLQERSVAYDDRPNMSLDVYGEKSSELKPVIMFWHGGSWRSGNKIYYQFMADYIEKLGAIPVIVGYPLAPKQTFPGFIEDAQAAVRWARHNIAEYGGNPDRIYVMGHSAGAHLALITTLQDDDQSIAGCIALATPVHISHSYYADVFTERAFTMGLENPINHISISKHRFMLVHGKTDRIVSYEASIELDEALRKAGNTTELILLRFMGHMRLLTTMVRPFAYRYHIGKQVKAFISE